MSPYVSSASITSLRMVGMIFVTSRKREGVVEGVTTCTSLARLLSSADRDVRATAATSCSSTVSRWSTEKHRWME
jgi:hypothetical protein